MKSSGRRRAEARAGFRGKVFFWVPLLAIVFGAGMVGLDVGHAKGRGGKAKACTQTTLSAYKACQSEIKDDYWIAAGKCANLADAAARAACQQAAWGEFKESLQTCGEQREARQALCAELGQDPYDPRLDPARFVDPADIGGAVAPNRYYPLVANTKRVYEVTDDDGNLLERITVTVTEDTKEIEYPAGSGKVFACAVVTDLVEEYDPDEEVFTVKEDTHDWYAQDVDGNVWYFGEIARNFEDGELVDVEGSWMAGRDGAKPGIIMFFYPEDASEPARRVYRQEFLLGDAEDIGEFVAFLDSLTVRGVQYRKVLQTKDYTPIEPEVFEFKYYAPGVGVILELGFEDDAATGEKVELVPAP